MKSLADQLLKMVDAKKIERSATSKGGLYDVLDEIAKELKIKTPEVYMPNSSLEHSHPILNSIINKPNAASISKDKILINKSILKLLNSENLNAPVSQELKAVLGHEMHHCANRSSMMLMSRAPIFAMPAIAVAGMYIYDKAKNKAEAEKKYLTG
jgi:Zn-dependent protease with chaperone function